MGIVIFVAQIIIVILLFFMEKVGNDQENGAIERNSHSKSRDGIKLN